jgi:hypothetical protein
MYFIIFYKQNSSILASQRRAKEVSRNFKLIFEIDHSYAVHADILTIGLLDKGYASALPADHGILASLPLAVGQVLFY